MLSVLRKYLIARLRKCAEETCPLRALKSRTAALRWLKAFRHPDMIPELVKFLCLLYSGRCPFYSKSGGHSNACDELARAVYEVLQEIDNNWIARRETLLAIPFIVTAFDRGDMADGWRSRTLIEYLGDWNATAAVPCLGNMLNNSADSATRIAAAEALLKIDDSRCPDIVKHAFLNSGLGPFDKSVKEMLLQRCGARALLPAFDSEDVSLRLSAIGLLEKGTRSEDRSLLVAACLRCCSDSDCHIRNAAERALNSVGVFTPRQIADKEHRDRELRVVMQHIGMYTAKLLDAVIRNDRTGQCEHFIALCETLSTSDLGGRESLVVVTYIEQKLSAMDSQCATVLLKVLKHVSLCSTCCGSGVYEATEVRSNSGLSNSGGSRSLGMRPCWRCSGTGRFLNKISREMMSNLFLHSGLTLP